MDHEVSLWRLAMPWSSRVTTRIRPRWFNWTVIFWKIRVIWSSFGSMRLEALAATTRVALAARIRNERKMAFVPRKRCFLHILTMVLIFRELRCNVYRFRVETSWVETSFLNNENWTACGLYKDLGYVVRKEKETWITMNSLNNVKI